MAAEPYTVHLPDEVLEDLQRRLVNARLPQDFANDDWGYGVNGAYLRELVDYWIEGYDWRAVEREINAFANYRTEIQGVPIHFIHERGKGPDPKPLILSHGWPWCFWDFHELIGPLTDPAAHGGDERDAFDVVLPSLPGFGFSAPHSVPGINFWRTADLWAELMGDVLGYDRFLAHGGDWGNLVSAQLGHKYADRVGAIHITGAIPLTVLANPSGASLLGQRTTTPEQAARNPDLVEPGVLRPRPGSAHVAVQLNEPQTISYALHDSPVGLCAWILDRRYWWSDNDRGERAVEQAFSKDHLLTLMMLYWATGAFVTSARYYAEVAKNPWRPSHDRQPVVEAPTGITLPYCQSTSTAALLVGCLLAVASLTPGRGRDDPRELWTRPAHRRLRRGRDGTEAPLRRSLTQGQGHRARKRPRHNAGPLAMKRINQGECESSLSRLSGPLPTFTLWPPHRSVPSAKSR